MRHPDPDEATMLARLRDEALRERPAFSGTTHERTLAAVRRTRPLPAGRGSSSGRRTIGLAACLGLACATVAWWSGRRGGPDGGATAAVAGIEAPGIETLPTFEEIGADVAGGIGSLAATIVGLPDLGNLAAADLAILDEWRLDGGEGAADGPAGRGAVR